MAGKWLWEGVNSAGQVVKTYSLGGRTVAVNRDGEWTYLFQDHLGSPTLETDYDGRAGARWKYEPYGTMRASEWTLPIDRGFTGQVIERGLGLHDYAARHYAQPLGRWIAPDTIVPDPGDPQALNRYSYVLNNPLRYTDPTGMFEQEAIEEYLQSLNPDNWQDILKLWMADDQWWTALLTAQTGDILTALDTEGNMRFARFEGEGRIRLSGLTLTGSVFGNENLATARLDEVYGGSLGLLAAVVTFNQQGQMNAAYGLNGFRVDVSTVSKAHANLNAFMSNVGLGAIYTFIPAVGPIQWLVKLVGTAGAGVYVFPEVRCTLGLCNGDQWLTVSMSEFSRGSENVLPHYYWKYYSEIRYHERAAVYRRSIAR